jgi:uncharacterized membrane protein
MKFALRFLKATLVGGFLFMVPFILLLVVLRHGVEFAKKAVGPLVAHLPVRSVAGVTIATLAAAAVLLSVALVAGLIAQTSTGRKIKNWLENTIVGRMPGYSILKGLVGGAGDLEGGKQAAPALAWIEECWVYALVLEVHADGNRTVFVPGAPSPLSGAVYFLPEDRIRPLDVPLASVMATIHRMGIGSEEILKGRLGPRGSTGR